MAAMAPLLSRKVQLKIKAESTKGTEITGDTDILVADPVLDNDGEFVKRNGVGLYRGSQFPGIVQGKTGRCTFSMDFMATTGHAINPGLAILLPACGLALDTATYKTHSTIANDTTVSIDMFQDGLEKTLFGSAGNVTLAGESGKRLICSFDFLGKYKAIAETTFPATFTPASQKPMLIESGTFTMGGQSKLISRFSLNLGNIVGFRQDPAGYGGIAHALVTDYDPEISIDPEAESDLDGVPTSAFESLWRAGTEAAVVLVASDGTDKVTITLPKVQCKSLKTADRNGILVYDWVGQCNHSSGNDAVQIIVAAM